MEQACASLTSAPARREVASMLARESDMFEGRGIRALATVLTAERSRQISQRVAAARHLAAAALRNMRVQRRAGAAALRC